MKVLLINASPRKHGATQAILDQIAYELGSACELLRLSDYAVGYCFGCKSCYATAKCVQMDDVEQIMRRMEAADAIVLASPSYWGDMTGQLKVFIDRCAPYCNTHEPHASLPEGKRGYAVALRTGPSSGECSHIIEGIRHFFGHLNIPLATQIHFCGIENAGDLEPHISEIRRFARSIL